MENIFTNGVFYTPINGEIYQLKFKSLSIPLSYSKDSIINFNQREINTIIVDIASIGEMFWNNYNKSFDAKKIYQTIEDCIECINPIFVFRAPYGLRFSGNVPKMETDIWNCIPPCGFWDWYDYQYSVGGEWRPKTYQWDGLSPQLRRMETKDKEKVRKNENCDLHFDLVTESFILDKDYLKTCYASREECVNANHVKVHTF